MRRWRIGPLRVLLWRFRRKPLQRLTMYTIQHGFSFNWRRVSIDVLWA